MKYFDTFPTLTPNSVVVDNVTTLQLPLGVLRTVEEILSMENVSPAKGNSPLSNLRAKEVYDIKQKVRTFLKGEEHSVIDFVSSATDAMEKVAYQLCMNYLKNGDEILLSPEDHTSTIAPWIKVTNDLKRLGKVIDIKEYSYTDTGELDLEDIYTKITERTKLFIGTHIHNVYGAKNELDFLRIKEKMSKMGILLLDVSDSVGRIEVNATKLGADIMLFSGSKIFALPGAGVLYYTQSTIEKMMSHDTEQPFSFETGSRNYIAIKSLESGINFIEEYGQKNISSELSILTRYAIESLSAISRVAFTKGVGNCDITCSLGYGIVSFSVSGIASSEIAYFFADKGITVRGGDLCNHDNDYIRLGLHVYNTKDDIDAVVNALKEFLG
jgi:cysteine desulfurase/selenocysteine lyase